MATCDFLSVCVCLGFRTRVSLSGNPSIRKGLLLRSHILSDRKRRIFIAGLVVLMADARVDSAFKKKNPHAEMFALRVAFRVYCAFHERYQEVEHVNRWIEHLRVRERERVKERDAYGIDSAYEKH